MMITLMMITRVRSRGRTRVLFIYKRVWNREISIVHL